MGFQPLASLLESGTLAIQLLALKWLNYQWESTPLFALEQKGGICSPLAEFSQDSLSKSMGVDNVLLRDPKAKFPKGQFNENGPCILSFVLFLKR